MCNFINVVVVLITVLIAVVVVIIIIIIISPCHLCNTKVEAILFFFP